MHTLDQMVATGTFDGQKVAKIVRGYICYDQHMAVISQVYQQENLSNWLLHLYMSGKQVIA